MKKIIACLSMSASVFFFSCNNENENNKAVEEHNEQTFDNKMEKDASFAADAATGGMMEVELGNIALTNSSSPRVKEFGQMMVTDHTAANNELKATAQAKNIALPAIPDNDKQKKIDDMRKLTGKDFDKDYMDMMVKDHKDDIDLFQKEADNGNDADLKAWAAAKLPVLRQHLQMAEAIQEELKKLQ